MAIDSDTCSRRAFLQSAAAVAVDSRMPVLRKPVIDSHVHIWKRDARFPFVPHADVPPGIDASAEALLAHMQANNVSHTVLIQVRHYMFDNSYLIDTLKRYPGRFQGVCRVDPQDPAAPEHLSQHTTDGCRGVRLSPADDASGNWIRGALMPPLWQRCENLRVPMTLLLTTNRLPDVMPLIERHPGLTVVIDHMADCPVNDSAALAKLLALARFPNVFVKISHMWSLSRQPYPYPDSQALVARVRDGFGSSRLMWATDWPIVPETVSYADRVRLYREHLPFLNTAEREDILIRTVQKVWPFPAA